MLHRRLPLLPSAPSFRPTRDDPTCIQMDELRQMKSDILKVWRCELVYSRPEFAGVSPPVASVEDEDVSTKRPLQHGRQLVQHERLGPVVICFKLHEEGAPEELHRAIIILF